MRVLPPLHSPATECLAGCSRATAARAALIGQRTARRRRWPAWPKPSGYYAPPAAQRSSPAAGLQALHNRIVESAAELRDQLRHTQITALVNQIAPELTAAIVRELAALQTRPGPRAVRHAGAGALFGWAGTA